MPLVAKPTAYDGRSAASTAGTSSYGRVSANRRAKNSSAIASSDDDRPARASDRASAARRISVTGSARIAGEHHMPVRLQIRQRHRGRSRGQPPHLIEYGGQRAPHRRA